MGMCSNVPKVNVSYVVTLAAMLGICNVTEENCICDSKRKYECCHCGASFGNQKKGIADYKRWFTIIWAKNEVISQSL